MQTANSDSYTGDLGNNFWRHAIQFTHKFLKVLFDGLQHQDRVQMGVVHAYHRLVQFVHMVSEKPHHCLLALDVVVASSVHTDKENNLTCFLQSRADS